MILRKRARKANGLHSDGFWYVASEYVKADGSPCFTISMNLNNAHHFTKEEAHAFNRKFMDLGIIDAPFDIMK